MRHVQRDTDDRQTAIEDDLCRFWVDEDVEFCSTTSGIIARLVHHTDQLLPLLQ